MGLFSRRPSRVEPYRLFADDQEQLDSFLGRGAEASTPRSLEVSVTFSKQAAAEAASEELGEKRVFRELCEPSHGVDEWTLLLHASGQPLVPDVLRERIDLARDVAGRHGGVYEGWTAMYTKEEKAAWGVEPI